jgi:hypothetical protein
MPTKRTRRSRTKKSDVPSTVWYFLNDSMGDLPEDSIDQFDLLELECSTYPHRELKDLWTAYRNEILKRWMLIKPGTRPHCWWLFEAPRLPKAEHGQYKNWHLAKGLKEPRKRLSGVGVAKHDVLRVSPSYRYGIPATWIDSFDCKYYNGTAKSIHGNLINPKAKDGDFEGIAIDPNDPPIFESQAAYLDRFGLLAAEEKEKSSFEPESVLDVIGSHLINLIL